MSVGLLKIKNARKIALFLFDIVCFLIADVFYLLVSIFVDRKSFDGLADEFLISSAILMAFVFVLRIFASVYFNIWRYSGTSAYLKMISADWIGCACALVVSCLAKVYIGIWHFLLVTALTSLLTLAARLLYRQLYKYLNKTVDSDMHKIPVAIVGAGQMGVLLAEELLYNKHSNYKPVFFIDRNRAKAGSSVVGLKVYYEDENILDFIKNQAVSEIFIALTDLDSERMESLYNFYDQTSCKIKLYDTPIREMEDNGSPKKGKLREFRIEDLLFRKPLKINNKAAFDYYRDKVILVTGGGGSIGSELCRQIAKCKPRQLIILDIYENNAYDIQQELLREYGDRLNLEVEIASVRDRVRLEAIFAAYRPNIMFHAAAHKHVPLMEHSACEAIKNNVMGTYNTADMAEKYGVEKFILISTDKAVNPTNIMGATKRMCEMVIQCRNNGKTNFAAVRFGNVLGSNGSVIPLFRRQIENGGPVTITDKRIIRYFMTIPEASQLVIQAGAMAKKGELFVLDMGKPVRIYDLAVNMIRLADLEPNVDIKIEEIGLRPGEKLYEELLMKTETLTKTENDMIFIEKDTPLTREQVQGKVDMLLAAVKDSERELDASKVKNALHNAVPTFKSAAKVNKKAANATEMKEVQATEEIPTTI